MSIVAVRKRFSFPNSPFKHNPTTMDSKMMLLEPAMKIARKYARSLTPDTEKQKDFVQEFCLKVLSDYDRFSQYLYAKRFIFQTMKFIAMADYNKNGSMFKDGVRAKLQFGSIGDLLPSNQPYEHASAEHATDISILGNLPFKGINYLIDVSKGFTFTEVAEANNVSRTTVATYFKEAQASVMAMA